MKSDVPAREPLSRVGGQRPRLRRASGDLRNCVRICAHWSCVSNRKPRANTFTSPLARAGGCGAAFALTHHEVSLP
jgi:hypothetical protein